MKAFVAILLLLLFAAPVLAAPNVMANYDKFSDKTLYLTGRFKTELAWGETQIVLSFVCPGTAPCVPKYVTIEFEAAGIAAENGETPVIFIVNGKERIEFQRALTANDPSTSCKTATQGAFCHVARISVQIPIEAFQTLARAEAVEYSTYWTLVQGKADCALFRELAGAMAP